MTVSESSLVSPTEPQVLPEPVMAPKATKPPGPAPALTWAEKMRKAKESSSQKMAQAAQRQHPARGAFPGQAQPIPGDQKESEPIKIDPIAKKINDIIYADDKPETDGKFKYFVELITM